MHGPEKYAPFSVMRAMESRRIASYWTSNAPYDSLLTYIERDFDGLQGKVADLVAGERLPVNTPEVRRLVQSADATLCATLAQDADAVAASVGAAHDSRVGPDWYNNEQSLRFAVKLAYLTAIDRYAVVEELPSGHGHADLVYLPKRYARIPALVVGLKWNKPTNSALNQIRDRNYPKVLEDYGGPILLVGITYDTKTKKHAASIERVRK